jgi:hypothetical protein
MIPCARPEHGGYSRIFPRMFFPSKFFGLPFANLLISSSCLHRQHFLIFVAMSAHGKD